MRLLVVCCIILFNVPFINAQQLFVEKYPMSVYGAGIQSWTMAQDSQGVLYIANNDGVVKYDGISWDLMPIANQNYVFSLGLNSKNEIFVGSYNELGYFRKDSAANYKYHTLLPLLPKTYKNLNDLRQTMVFNDEVFFNNNKNIFRYSKGTVKIFNVADNWLFRLKTQLFSLGGNGLLVYKNGQFVDAGFARQIAGLHIKRIADYENGKYLLLDDSNRLWSLNPLQADSNKKMLLLTQKPVTSTKNVTVRSLLYLDMGKIALVAEEGVYLLNKAGETVNFNSKDMLGLNLNTGFCFLDRAQNIWLGADTYITQLISSSPLSIYDNNNGLDGTILSLGKKGNDLYVGTDKALFYKNSNSTFSAIPGTESENWNMFNFGNKLYLAHRTGVFEIQGKKAIPLIHHLFIQTLGEVKNKPDCMIMGTYNTGIWLLSKEGNAWHEKKIRGFEQETRYIQQDDEGNVWISHYNKGIYKLRLNAEMDSVMSTAFYDTKNGLPSTLNNRIYRLNNGRIIATTTNGFYSYNKVKNRFEPDAVLGKVSHGVCIYTVRQTARGDIYFWGAPSKKEQNAGAFIKQPNGSFKLLFTPFKKIALATHGLLPVDVDAPVLAAGANEIWIGNLKRVVNYRPNQPTYYHKSLPVYIKTVKAADSTIFATGVGLQQSDIPFSKNRLKFIFTSPFFEDADKILYQYQLNGFEDKWSGWSHDKEVSFTNLADGNYIFFVRAKNIYGQISRPAYYSFYVNAPWFKTWWAYLLYILTGALLFYLFSIFNNGLIKRQKLALEQKVTEKTRELSDKNNEILAQSKALQESNLTKDKLFSIISHDLRGPIGQLKQTLDLVKSGSISLEELEELIPHLDENIGSAFSLTDNLLYWAKSQMEGIQVNPVLFDIMEIADENYHLFKLNADTKHIELVNNINKSIAVYGDRDMIKLVLRNLIGNATKFTAVDGKITLGYSTKPGFVEVYVKDTGGGMSAEDITKIFRRENFHKDGTSGEKGSGLGLSLCQDFIQKNGGKLTIQSKLGQGSKISFWLKSDDKISTVK